MIFFGIVVFFAHVSALIIEIHTLRRLYLLLPTEARRRLFELSNLTMQDVEKLLLRTPWFVHDWKHLRLTAELQESIISFMSPRNNIMYSNHFQCLLLPTSLLLRNPGLLRGGHGSRRSCPLDLLPLGVDSTFDIADTDVRAMLAKYTESPHLIASIEGAALLGGSHLPGSAVFELDPSSPERLVHELNAKSPASLLCFILLLQFAHKHGQPLQSFAASYGKSLFPCLVPLGSAEKMRACYHALLSARDDGSLWVLRPPPEWSGHLQARILYTMCRMCCTEKAKDWSFGTSWLARAFSDLVQAHKPEHLPSFLVSEILYLLQSLLPPGSESSAIIASTLNQPNIEDYLASWFPKIRTNGPFYISYSGSHVHHLETRIIKNEFGVFDPVLPRTVLSSSIDTNTIVNFNIVSFINVLLILTQHTTSNRNLLHLSRMSCTLAPMRPGVSPDRFILLSRLIGYNLLYRGTVGIYFDLDTLIGFYMGSEYPDPTLHPPSSRMIVANELKRIGVTTNIPLKILLDDRRRLQSSWALLGLLYCMHLLFNFFHTVRNILPF